MQKLNILVLSHSMPVFPGGAGHEYLNLLNLRSIAGHIGLVSQVHTASEKDAALRLAQAGVDTYLFENMGTAGASSNHLPRTTTCRMRRRIRGYCGVLLQLLSPQPFDIRSNDLYFRNTAPALLDAVAARAWHVLIVIQSNAARTIEYLPSFQSRVLVFHDIRARVFERRSHLPIGFVNRILSSINARRYWKFEAKYARLYDQCVTLSRDDSAAISGVAPEVKPLVVPIPVDAEYFRRAGVPEDPNLIVFSGMMNHPPNVDAAKFLVEDIFPAIRKRHPTAKLLIVGKNPLPEVTALGRTDGVEVTGFVPDIRPYIESAAVVVVTTSLRVGRTQQDSRSMESREMCNVNDHWCRGSRLSSRRRYCNRRRASRNRGCDHIATKGAVSSPFDRSNGPQDCPQPPSTRRSSKNLLRRIVSAKQELTDTPAATDD